ncbi:hypothetical protein [Streptomyces sp. SLBN-8D4]|jgi:hypothetical protein|uniref:hypothetical protein n=1 Tax=Streptomyces sp. SLBN-8D4 TaxID=3377728 RepID=UPI003C7D0333
MTHTDDLTAVRAKRQLRRIRAFYAAGVILWAASSAWTMWDSPGTRPMWTSLLLLAVFTGLLAMASRWLWRLEPSGSAGPSHHAAFSGRTGRHAVSKT